MKCPILKIEITAKEDGADGLKMDVSGSPNQVLGFIARARFELSKIENSVIETIKKDVSDR